MLFALLLFIFIPSVLLLSALAFLFLYIAVYRAPSITSRSSLGRSAAVVVLGDVGRSPRMCYHVESLADEGWKVSIIGYGGSKLPSSIQRSSVKFQKMREVPSWIAKLPRLAFVVVAPFKLFWQSAALFWNVALVVQPPPEVIFVQTPPALPSLLIIRLCSLLLSSRVIIDWHNLAYTILALRLGSKSPLVRLARWLESKTGRHAFAHLFVTHAMRRHLEAEWKLQGHKAVLHDRPPKHFRKTTCKEAHTLWKGLAPKLNPSLDGWWPHYDSGAGTTPFTSHNPTKNTYKARQERPALVVSSTSWTADEDFGLLLRAAQEYEKRAKAVNSATSASPPRSSPSSPMLDAADHQQRRTLDILDRSNPGDSGKAGGSSSMLSVRSSSSDRISAQAGLTEPNSGSPSNQQRFRRHRGLSLLSQRPASSLPNLPAQQLPHLLIIVTGKGEQRAFYEQEIQRLEREEKWEWVRIRTAWLENWEYPLLLGSADLGVSLHTSSSGLDLPMKGVDMLGCQLPVLALDFPCLEELIQHGKNGLTFKDEDELCLGLESLLAGFPYADADGEGSNWLVHNGGLRDPFAHAGRDSITPASASQSMSASPSLTSAPGEDVFGSRQSLEGNEQDALLTRNRTSLDFSKGGLPTSNSFGSLSGSSSPLFRMNSGDTMQPPRPSTPTPSFTMLASPMLGSSSPFFASDCDMGDRATSMTASPRASTAKTTTWAANWKATVRPLLRLADEEDAIAQGDVPDEAMDTDDEASLVDSPAMASAKSTPRAGMSPTQRIGLSGKPLRVRGGSVHGLLWGEDFASELKSTMESDTDDDDADDEFSNATQGDFLSRFGIVVGSPVTSRRAKTASSAPSTTTNTPNNRRKVQSFTPSHSRSHDRKRSDEDSGLEPVQSVGLGLGLTSSRDASQHPQHLRHRTAHSTLGGMGGGDWAAEDANHESIPDIWVSQPEGGSPAVRVRSHRGSLKGAQRYQ
ncbi:unnamed protein product [Jaminaea pallidilutea]